MTAAAARYVARVLLLIWPFLLAAMVLHRQAHPFRVVSDDHSYYRIAKRASEEAASGWKEGGILHGAKRFADACSARGTLPAHVNRNRPLLIWIWSISHFLGGDMALQWIWRVFYLFTVLAHFLLLRRISSLPVASALSGIIAVAPATQGLLSWMSCATYVVSYPFVLLGTAILLGKKSFLSTAAGMGLVLLALLSRDVMYLLVPGAVSVFLYISGRKRLAIALALLTILRWWFLPSENRAAISTMTTDPILFLRGALLIAAGQSASLIRNLGLAVLIPSIFLVQRRKWLAVAASALALVSGHASILLPAFLVILTVSRNNRSLPGACWVVITVASMGLYGQFTSRYAFEPLIGLSLALAPAIPSLGRKTRFVVIPILLWYTAVSIAPDMLYRHETVRKAANLFDQRIRTLDLVTSIRLKEWSTFAGRTKGDWMHHEDLRFASAKSQQILGRVWQSGPFWRVGNIPKLHCPRTDHLIFTQKMIWEWNVWYWRVMPPRKARGMMVNIPSEAWSVRAGPSRGGPERDLCIISSSNQHPGVTKAHALRGWLSDIPELNDPDRAKELLQWIWHSEGRCTADFANSSFQQLELARLLLRDDGWIDSLEFSYVVSG